MQRIKRFCALFAALLCGAAALSFTGCADNEDGVTLRVCSWEEYIDLGGWDEAIELESGEIIGEKPVYEDFEEWFNATHDYKVKVEYSTFGTNEDLYNRLSLGDVYDLVCPSDYMIMKLIAEDKTVDFSEDFWSENEENYYKNFVSPYIDGAADSIFNSYGWNKKAACYMWGTTGIVYNPEKIADEKDVSGWDILLNENYKRQVTVKDNVRDAYFATLGIINSEKLADGKLSPEDRSRIMNETETETIEKAGEVLKQIKENVYSFETDAGKADMVTGKVVANFQWSGDAIAIMDEADGETELWYSVPDECANLWFDGWIMLKSGVAGDTKRQTAAEAFVNFLSKPKNAVRNMSYIGYTSAIAGDTVFQYLEYNYGAEDGETEAFDYDVSYFFGENKKIAAPRSEFDFEEDGKTVNRGRQLFAQYPPENVKDRSVVMLDFGDKLSEINQMWINVRCLDAKDISPATVGIIAGVIAALVAAVLLYAFRYKLFIKKHTPKKGYIKTEN